MEEIDNLKKIITSQTKQIEELNATIKQNQQELDKYKHIGSRLRHEKHKVSRYNRDRIILLIFSILMFSAVCYLFNEQNKAAAEQERLQRMYKQQNETKPPPGVLSSENYFKEEE